MGYKRQNFTDGQVLEAKHLNHMEAGIAANESELANKQPKGDYLTEHQKIKTINGQSLVGEGDITIESGNSGGGCSMWIGSEEAYNATTIPQQAICFITDEETPGDDIDETTGVLQSGAVVYVYSGMTVTQSGNVLTMEG